MEKSEIVNKLLEEGFLVSPNILDQLTEEKLNSLLPTLKTKNTLVISKLDEPEISFSIKRTETPKTFSVKDFVQYYNTKYNILKNILCTKLNPIPINKITQNTASTTVIGIVSEKIVQGYVIEDPTGKLEIIYEKHLPKNTVFGFTGDMKDKKMIVTAVSYPDIPLDKKIKSADLTLSLSLEKGLPSIKINNKKEIKDFKTPVFISIKKGQDISVLAFKPESVIKRTDSIEYLKLRCLPEPTVPDENFIISEVPDVFWIIQKDIWEENYKGVKIISGESAGIDT